MIRESELKVLDHLSLAPDGKGFVSQIARDIGMSKGEVSKALKTLRQDGLISGELSGRNMVCSVDRTLPVMRRLRTAFNLLELLPKIRGLHVFAQKIILFGSCAQGSDTLDSDMDILVIARDKQKVNGALQKIRFKRPVQWVLKTPQEYVILNNRKKVFAREIAKGIVLWETYETSGI